MNNPFRILNQLYYLMYTLIILLTVLGYFLNLNNLLNIDVQGPVELVLIGSQLLTTLLAFGYYFYFLYASRRLKNIKIEVGSVQHYLKTAKIRLFFIGVSLVVGVACMYLLHSIIVLYLLAISAILLLLSKPNEANIFDVLSK